MEKASARTANNNTKPPCVEGKAHHWHLESPEEAINRRGKQDQILGVCKNCELLWEFIEEEKSEGLSYSRGD